jgi:hypothetical protein
MIVTKLKQKGIIQSMMLGGSDIQYYVVFLDNKTL